MCDSNKNTLCSWREPSLSRSLSSFSQWLLSTKFRLMFCERGLNNQAQIAWKVFPAFESEGEGDGERARPRQGEHAQGRRGGEEKKDVKTERFKTFSLIHCWAVSIKRGGSVLQLQKRENVPKPLPPVLGFLWKKNILYLSRVRAKITVPQNDRRRSLKRLVCGTR